MSNSRKALGVLSWLVLAACGPEANLPSVGSAEALSTSPQLIRAEHPIRDQYVVVLAQPPEGVTTQSVSSMATTLAARHGGQVLQVYERALRGFAVRMTEEQALALARNPAVASVEEDGLVQVDFVQSPPGNVGKDRIDQRNLPLDNQYTYFGTGVGTHAYVISTGIRTTHTEFGGRATGDFTVISDGNGASDCNGVGTHWAAVIGGNTYGVARSTRLHSVRVLNCTGTGTTSGVITGVDWVTANHIKPAVALLGLSGPASAALDAAVNNSIAAGVTYVASAGSSGGDSCTQSPARIPAVLTVGSSSATDTVSSFSGTGSCVDLFAPGANIISAWHTNDTAVSNISGSVGAAFGAGAAALWLEVVPSATPAAVNSAIISNATTGVLTPPPTPPTPNRLLYTGFIGSRLRAGTPVSDISNPQADVRYFRLEVPVGTTQLTFSTSGGTGDVDLYVKAGTLPSTSTYDCAPFITGNAETCILNAPTPGTWYVMLHGFAPFSAVSLTSTVTQ
ncbi:S8 family peptidase [Hyalangium rubrum]|uniref:S8 family peptidase n=1 Tax=Hyalangium rubrum TaxID=3103134 RepID=A0ABU5H682_9BACT|nr:S8 family peptidase [Hyalangium sp. s54d21]MDY7227605.1 S8 family peptidase [Hyalangium sp. s54d21]